MTLETYGSLDEKKNFFEKNEQKGFKYHLINTIKDLDRALIEMKELEVSEESADFVFIFRGVSEAKYKLYTSAQREWITNEWEQQGISFSEFIGRQLFYTKAGFIKNYFQSMGIAINDLLLLSFLQHYRAPSPLLDFTTDPEVSLFFALEHMQGISPGSQDIGNYFSIYVILMNKERSLDVSLKQQFEHIAKLQVAIEDLQKTDDIEIPDEEAKKYPQVFNWLPNNETGGIGLCCARIRFLPNPLDAVHFKHRALMNLYWSNPNIVAQKGCFLLNTHGKKPLEERLLEEIEAEIKERGAVNSIRVVCFDIHKSLASYIQGRYMNKSPKEIYPDFYAIANEAYEAFKRNPTAKISLADLPDSKD